MNILGCFARCHVASGKIGEGSEHRVPLSRPVFHSISLLTVAALVVSCKLLGHSSLSDHHPLALFEQPPL